MEKPDCKICRAEVLHVNVDNLLIRPLGHAFSAQLHVVLDQNLTLKEAHKIQQKKLNAAVSERFGTEETTVIHLARRGLYRQARPRHIYIQGQNRLACSCFCL
jgi:divalent metal cation (Fe/Co/Zn/Cd) transporter